MQVQQALPINLQEDAQPEVHDSDDDPEDSKCDHKLFLKEDVGYVCGNCGIITTPIEDVVPQVVSLLSTALSVFTWSFRTSNVELACFRFCEEPFSGSTSYRQLSRYA